MRQHKAKSNHKSLDGVGLYESEENPEYKMKLALYRYQNEDISIGKAAEIAGVCWEDMKRILIKNGIRPKLGPETIEEARQEYLLAKEIADEINRKNFVEVLLC
jgi:predicted HTH domain antitoxin